MGLPRPHLHRAVTQVEILNLLVRVRLSQHNFGRCHIFFNVGSGQSQHRPQSLEAIPFRILEQAAGIRCVILDADQISHRIDILFPCQPVIGNSITPSHPCRFAFFHTSRQPFYNLRDFDRRWLRFCIFGRHLTGVDSFDNLGPVRSILHPDFARQRIDPKFSFLFF